MILPPATVSDNFCSYAQTFALGRHSLGIIVLSDQADVLVRIQNQGHVTP